MATTNVRKDLDQFPEELTEAIDGLSGEAERAVFTLLFNEGEMAFSEIQERVGAGDELHGQTLTDAISELKSGGLIRKRIADAKENELTAYYSTSTFGERFTYSLFDSLGTINGSGGRRHRMDSNKVLDDDLLDSGQDLVADLKEEMADA
ncbi:hypothetical protein [Haloarcula sp. CGMCC 1.6347]|uniref:hypothetical protein n=1 Tax=Haloarcula sp. CGMCC 1.6347 TaxID=3111455 RepID=UPI00300F419B